MVCGVFSKAGLARARVRLRARVSGAAPCALLSQLAQNGRLLGSLEGPATVSAGDGTREDALEGALGLRHGLAARAQPFLVALGSEHAARIDEAFSSRPDGDAKEAADHARGRLRAALLRCCCCCNCCNGRIHMCEVPSAYARIRDANEDAAPGGSQATGPARRARESGRRASRLEAVVRDARQSSWRVFDGALQSPTRREKKVGHTVAVFPRAPACRPAKSVRALRPVRTAACLPACLSLTSRVRAGQMFSSNFKKTKRAGISSLTVARTVLSGQRSAVSGGAHAIEQRHGRRLTTAALRASRLTSF